ncbi:unnamed protein product [Vicia faba]|uniref:MADS-box domain-containing protein n=1 Tax=Vicia faba TaxID=3906 RepID=A0AAV0ZGH8_VICFA|nr:unnamed protein product [Vicia faba]
MTRKKVKLAFIENNTARKSAYNKRKKSLVKKVDELTALCGIDACAIIYGPYDAQPEIWPSPSGVQEVLSKFMTVPEVEQSRKMMNQESFLKQRISKSEKQLQKQRRDNREKETTMHMFRCLNAGNIVQNSMSVGDLNDLSWMIDHNLRAIGRRMESDDRENIIHQSPPPPPPPTAPNNNEIAMMGHGHAGMAMNNNDLIQSQMFMDMGMNGYE